MPDREDLLRIDGTGTVHPVGRGASQELRPRKGEWRLLRSPPELVVLRSVSAGDAVLKLAGEVRNPGALSDIVALVAQSGWFGELVVLTEEGIRSFYFDGGALIGATTTVEEERLGETMYRFGVITRGELDSVVKYSEETGKRLGEAALDLEIVPPEKLFSMMARQVEEVFYAAIHVSEAAFYFFDRFDEERIVRRHNLNAGALLMESARRMDEMSFFREKVPSDLFLVVPASGKEPPEDLKAIFEACDGKRSVEDLGRIVGQLEFEVTRSVFQLIKAGCVSVVPPRPQGPEAIVEVFNLVLEEIHRRCDACVQGPALRDGLCRFATGGGIYDPLFMGAGPADDGTLNPERIARNIAALAGEDPDAWLVQLMNEYVGFAIFQTESFLSREEQASLLARATELLKPLRPLIDAGPVSRGLG